MLPIFITDMYTAIIYVTSCEKELKPIIKYEVNVSDKFENKMALIDAMNGAM